ncbi:MAG: sigma-70 family RNA polymerase sigma factor [Phycisphaerales bacterium]|nr:MAG: sigma-70 family RNA polymerase sigma factor [Phycisphaerales bacterium]
MRKIKSQNLAQLLMQLRFTPEKKRRKQLDAVEQLFAVIKKDKEYPFEFVCFRITGFHPKSEAASELIKGDELLEDLRIFMAKLSGRLAPPAAEQSQKIYTIKELSKTMHVSTKTVYRWRKRGLIARKYIFRDGIKRFGFLQSTVDEFLDAHPELVRQAQDFARLTDAQKDRIIKQAGKLSATAELSRHQIIARIRRQTGRSHETIRYTLLEYEKANPNKSALKNSTAAIEPAQAAELYRLFRQGCPVKELMERFGRNRSSIYRIINRRRAKALLARKIEFIPSEEFSEEDAEEKIRAKPTERPHQSRAKVIEPSELVDEYFVPEYLQILKETPVLTREREVELFRRYNYVKFLACRKRADVKLSHVSATKLGEIEGLLAEAEDIKRTIIEANLRLVVSIASRHTGMGTDFSELVSKGNFALINAVEEFDYTKGFRFGRRASLNIAKEYARLSGKRTRITRTRAGSLGDIERDMRTRLVRDVASIEKTRRSLVHVIKNELTESEQYVILRRYGLIGPPLRKETKTLQQIGEELGLSKERIRQIELTALQKLRQSLSSEQFELLTG